MGCGSSKSPWHHDHHEHAKRPPISHRSLEHAVGLVRRTRLVLELQHATNVPRMDIADESDVFAEAWVDSAKAPEGIECPAFAPRWGTRVDCAAPVWNRARELSAICEEGDEIVCPILGHSQSHLIQATSCSALLGGQWRPRTTAM